MKSSREFPKVSIITISYNSARTIEKTIKSVLAQSYSNKEYILIDGGSTDGTQDIIRRYASQLAFWSTEPDQGISDAFNKGIAQATGEVIGILNSDDYYFPGILEPVGKAFDDNPDKGFVFGDQIFVDEQEKVLFHQKGDPFYAREINAGMPSIPHPTAFVRKEVYEKCGGFDLDYKTAMDYELLLRFHRSGIQGCYLPKLLAAMRVGGESDRNYARAYLEVRNISIRYGFNRNLANVLYGWRVVKTFFRRLFEQKGLAIVVRSFRLLFSKRYTYE